MMTKEQTLKSRKKKKTYKDNILNKRKYYHITLILYIYIANSYATNKPYRKRNYLSVKVTNFKHGRIEQASLLLPSGKKPYIQRQQQHITHNV